MSKQASALSALIAATFLCGVAAAQEAEQRPQGPQGPRGQPPAAAPGIPASPFLPEPNTTLEALLEGVGERLGRQFLIDARARSNVYVGGIDMADVTYPLLLSILRANGLAAVAIEGRLNVVPEAEARQLPSRLVEPNARDVPDDEIVTMIVRLQNMVAPQAVPIMRPIMPQYAHLAAMVDQNALVIVDRFANARRIAELLEALDR